MTISEIGSIGELIGAIATVATLIYLALQIRENTRFSKRQALQITLDGLSKWGGRFNDNPAVLEICLDGLEDYDLFDEKKKHRYHFVLIDILMIGEAIFEHAKNNAIKKDSVDAANARILHELRGTGARAWWSEMGRTKFSKNFAEHVDRLVKHGDA